MRKKDKNMEKENEQFRVLGNRLKAYKEDKKCLAFVSTVEGQGKGYIIEKMAMMLAKSNQKVLILDLNFLENTLTKRYRLETTEGFAELVQQIENSPQVGNTRFTQQLGQVPAAYADYAKFLLKEFDPTTYADYAKSLLKELAPNIHLLACGETATLKERMIFPEKVLGEVFESFKENFDYIFVEVPSFEYFSYTQTLTRLVDGALLVIKAGVISKEASGELREQIESLGCDVLGSILNQTEKTFAKGEGLAQQRVVAKKRLFRKRAMHQIFVPKEEGTLGNTAYY